MRMSSARQVAADIIGRVLSGESLNHLLPAAFDQVADGQRPLCQELVYGTLREWPMHQGIIDNLIKKPLRKKDNDVLALIGSALYELTKLSTPKHAVVSETVNTVRLMKKQWASGLVNGVLRSFQRAEAQSDFALTPAQRRALPSWLDELIGQEYDDHLDAIAEASRHRPPMTLRVNSIRNERDAYLRLLTDADLLAHPLDHLSDGITLRQPVDVSSLPGFFDGLVSVQDSAAQRVADLINPQPGERILDACAAPGGKACHLLERQPDLKELVACDASANRLQRVVDNTERLGLTSTVIKADARTLPSEIVSPGFDAILADVPCSATGVMRRNPDIKILRRTVDIRQFAEQQLAILQGLWPALKPGGRLLYVTCSILEAENDAVVKAFAQQHKVQIMSIEMERGIARDAGWQVMPEVDGGDGLYFSLLSKPAD
jgi:16S rRNA (cytosine967-C5)-methyltransferase